MDTSQNLIEFLSRLRKLDVQLSLNAGNLACSAPNGVLTSELKATLKARKAEIIEFLEHNAASGAAPLIERSADRDAMAPSLAQQRLWFLEQFEPGTPAYVISSGLRFRGVLNIAILERCFREILDRHEVLRTAFFEVDGAPQAVLRPLGDWKIDVVPMPDVKEVDRVAESIKISFSGFRPFDLSRPPLLRARLLVFAPDDCVFLIDIHHICSDGWSLGLLTVELMTLYAAYSGGLPSPLPPPSFQYSDFSRWHRKYIEDGAIHSQIAYWRQKLKAPLPTADLPSDRPRPPVMSNTGTTSRQKLPANMVEVVRRFSLSEDVTPFITMLSAYKILLFRYTGQPDILVGSVTAGRGRPELEGIVGLFVNNLALRTDLSGDPTVRELLGRVRETVLGGVAHEDVPFDHLVEILQPPRDMSRPVLFQTMFLLQNFPFRNLEIPGLEISRVEGEGRTARYDLMIEAFELDGRFQLIWEYNTGLFDAATIGRMQGHYQTLLESLIANPDARISELQLLTSAEMDRFLPLSSLAADLYPENLCVHEWFEQQAAATPRAVAVVCEQQSLTYAELDLRSNQLAHYLRNLGVCPNQPVGLCLDRSVEMAVALLGIQKAGGAYVPIDPQYPVERVAFMLQDCGASVLVTSESLLSILPLKLPRVVCIDGDRPEFARMSGEPCISGATPGDLIYLIYTSGSTGRPKGVEITHRSVVNFLASMQRQPGIASSDRLLAVTTLSFDIAGLEFYLPLVSGAQLIIAPRAAVADGIALGDLLETSQATIVQATPVTWRLLLESGWRGSPRLKVLCGGEAFPRDLADRLLPLAAEVWNLYGPTETTIWSTVHRVDQRPGSVPIGHPVGNTDVYVLDEHMRLVAPGVVGELYIGGLGLARGYRARPELTAERFVSHPFRPGMRLYRTGDQARWLADGVLECLGRIDQQVKLRGYRIELGEIEATLEQQPSIKQAVVVVREDAPGDRRLIAYVVASSEADSAAAWRDALRTRLPEYMIPSAFVRLDAFPLTPNRKVDRKLLPAPESANGVSANYVPPHTNVEKELTAIWQDLLRTQRVGIHDNFFDLGGHSLLVVQLQSRLRQRFNRGVPLVELFQRPTVASMAGILTEAGMAGMNRH